MTPGEAVSIDLADLRAEFGESGWRFGTIWASAGTGPDARRLYASREGVLITSWNAAELRMKIRQEQRAAPAAPAPFPLPDRTCHDEAHDATEPGDRDLPGRP